jgi:hypothetical protein
LCIDYRKWLEWQDFTGTAQHEPNVALCSPQIAVMSKKGVMRKKAL